MAQRLDAQDPGFAKAYRGLIVARGGRLDAAEDAVRPLIRDVRARGLEAVLEATAKFDAMVLREADLAVTPAEVNAAFAACPKDLIAALELAAERIWAFHRRERPPEGQYTDEAGVMTGYRWRPVDRAGVYAPGGLAAYPSSVLMNVVPAKAAGVGSIAMATPPGRVMTNPAILAAAKVAGVDEIWRIGGAQAIAAMAYGAGPLAPCDVIAGPGNAYVAAAKKLVFGDVGVDSIAGPSEVFVLAAGGMCPPEWIAADLLAQAEHDEDAQSVLFTDDLAFADAVAAAVERGLAAGAAGPSAKPSWERHGAIIRVRTLSDALAWMDEAAPEHVEIIAPNAEDLAARLNHAGAIFLGAHAPEALGDYLAGPSHVLPTVRAARYSSGVSVFTFMKRTSLIGASAAALAQVGAAAARIADAEGLPAHAHSIRIRMKP